MSKKFLVGFLLIIQNFVVASEPAAAASSKEIYERADQTSFDTMQKIHEIAIQSAEELGFDKIVRVANLWLTELEASQEDRYRFKKEELVDIGGKFYYKRTAKSPSFCGLFDRHLLDGFILTKRQATAARPFNLISPFGMTELAYFLKKDDSCEAEDGSIKEDQMREISQRFFDLLKKNGLKLEFMHMSNYDDYRGEKDLSLEVVHAKIDKMVNAAAFRGSSEYLILKKQEGSRSGESTAFYKITAVHDDKLPEVQYLPDSAFPSIEEKNGIRTDAERKTWHDNRKAFQDLLEQGRQKYLSFKNPKDFKTGLAAAGAGSEELK